MALYGILGACCNWAPQRYVVAILTCTGISILYMQRASFSIILTQMVVERNKGDEPSGGTSCPKIETGGQRPKHLGEFDWSDSLQGDLIASFFYGYLITQLPGGVIADIWGGKHLFGACVLVTTLCTLFTPISARTSPYVLIAVRVVMGLAQGPLFGAVTSLVASWAPSNERSIMNTITNSGVPLGLFLGNIVSGELLGIVSKWDYVYYIYFISGVVWYVLWFLFVYNSPEDHPYVTDKEKEYIISNIEGESTKPEGGVPWLDILKSPYLYMIMICSVGSDFGFFVLSNELPVYLANVLQFKISDTGIVSGIPWLTMMAGTIIFGSLSDYLLNKGWFSKITLRKSNAFIASALPAVFIILASYSGCRYILVTVCFSLAMFFFGACYCSFRLSMMDLSPQWAGTIMSVVNGVGVTCGFATPKIAHSFMTNGGSLEEWRITFWIASCIMSIGLIPYVLCMTAKVQPWNEGKIDKTEK